MEIQLLIQRGLIYLFLLGLVLIVYHGLVTLISLTLQPTLQISALTAGAITTIIGIFTVPPIDYRLRKMTHRFFFSGQFDYSETLYELSQSLQETLRKQKIIDATVSKLETIFGADTVTITTNEDKSTLPAEYTLSFKLTTSNGEVGQLLLGPKQSGNAYTKRDKQMLSTIASQVAVALERSSFYETVKEYSYDLEQKVAERTSEIEALQLYQRQMLDEISHGLQTPTSIIINELSLLTTDQIPHTASLKSAIDSMSHFIHSLLNLSRIEAPGVTLPFAQFNLSDTITELMEYSELSLRQSGVSFVTSIESNLHIVGHQKKMEEVLHALLSNAVKYKDDTRHQTISVTVQKDGDHIILKVADTGHGISTEDLPQVFKRFYRVRDSHTSHIKGTGLGLAIVDAVIKKHNGTVLIESQRGVGTVFTITLPTNRKEEDPQVWETNDQQVTDDSHDNA